MSKTKQDDSRGRQQTGSMSPKFYNKSFQKEFKNVRVLSNKERRSDNDMDLEVQNEVINIDQIVPKS
jgi:hypothetical protein